MKSYRGLLVAAALCVAVAPAFAQQQQLTPAQQQQLRAQRAQQYKQATPPVAQPTPQPAPATSPASDQPVTTNVVVPANQVWAPAAQGLLNGGRLQITARGEWTIRGQQQNVRAAQVAPQYTGPDGYPQLTNERALLPTANIGALIGKIGENGAPFLIGANYDQPLTADGALFVAMNDIVDQYQDNQGRMAIQVVVAPPPPPIVETPQAQTPEAAPPTEATTVTTTRSTPSSPISPQLIQIALIGLAVLVGIIVIGSFFRPRSSARDPEKHAATAAQVGTRVVTDGVERQLLQLNVKGR